MSTSSFHILYCHCAFARVVPVDVKSAVLARLAESELEFDAVPDLCEMSARRDPRLAELASGNPLRIAACFPLRSGDCSKRPEARWRIPPRF
jgi:hypothetical protein